MGKRFSSISKLVGSNPGKTVAGAVAAAAAGLAANDLIQPKNNILRNYPVLGHARYLAKEIRPEIHQYFIEGEADGKPFDAQTREVINQRADGTDGERDRKTHV